MKKQNLKINRDVVSEPISGTTSQPKAMPYYCPHCLTLGLKGPDYVLQPRIYALKAGEAIPSDADRWLQCYVCGTPVPKHDVPQLGTLTTDVETIYSKFPLVENALPDARIAEQPGKPDKHERGFNPRRIKLGTDAKIDEIKDQDLKNELKRGAKLLNYTET
jgi:hypothetical protein